MRGKAASYFKDLLGDLRERMERKLRIPLRWNGYGVFSNI